MGSLPIRNLGQDIIARLKARALARGTSLAQFQRESVTRLVEPSQVEPLGGVRPLRARPRPSARSAAEDVRARRDGEDAGDWPASPDRP